MLKIQNLSVKYGENTVISKMNLEFQKGTVNVITGLSGCGKTTFLKVLNGIIPEVQEGETEGKITYQSHDLLEESITEKSGYLSTVFQNPKTQFYCVDSSDELAFGLENRNVEREEILSTIEKYTKLLKTEDLLHKNIFTLSGGEKQLLAITAVASLNNDIYLFDEPSASLDRSAIKRLARVLEILKNQNKIIIIAEHRLYYLRELLDRLVVLENGNTYDYSKKELEEKEEILKKKHHLRSFEEISRADLGEKRISKIRLLKEHPQKKGKEEKKNQFKEGEFRLECRNFKVKYEKPVLDFSMDFEKGVYFIIGENGVGKSTFVKRLCNINKGKGTRYYDGKKFRAPGKHISMVMQDVNYQIFTDSCFSELSVVAKDENAIMESLTEVGLEGKKEVHPQLLSGGEKQRLLIAKTKVANKHIIILDEPTSGLDKLQMQRMAEYLESFKKEGKTVLVITHDYELIREYDAPILEFIR